MKKALILFITVFFIFAPARSLYGWSGKDPRLSVISPADSFYFGTRKQPKVRLFAENVKKIELSVWMLREPSLPVFELNPDTLSLREKGRITYYREFFYDPALLARPSSRRDRSTGLVHTVSGEKDAQTYTISGDISLPVTANGIYVGELKAAGLVRRWVFFVTPWSMVVKNTPSQVAGFLYDQAADRPVAGAEVKLFSPGRFLKSTISGEDGRFAFPDVKLSERFTVIARMKGAHAPFAFYRYKLNPEEYGEVLYLYTDRPLYRPGHDVFFRGIAGIEEKGGLRLLTSQDLRVQIKDPKDVVLFDHALTTDTFGSFNDRFRVPDDAPAGFYSIKTTVNRKEFYDTFKVDFYRKPDFRIQIMPLESHIIQGHEARVKVKALYYTADPVGRAHYTYKIYATPAFFYPDLSRGFSLTPSLSEKREFVSEGEGTTDEQGCAEFAIASKKFDQDMCYIIAVSVTDELNKTAQSTLNLFAFMSTVRIAVTPGSALIRKKEPITMSVFLRDPDNNGVAGHVELSLQRAIWQAAKKKFDYVSFSTSFVDIDGTGEKKITLPVGRPGRIRIHAKAYDRAGNLATAQAFFWVEGRADVSKCPSLELIRDKVEYQAADEARVLVTTATPGVWAYISLEGDAIYHTEVRRLDEGSTTITVPIKKEYTPNVYLYTCYISKGQYAGGSIWLYVPGKDKFLRLEVTTDKTQYSPGDEVEYTLQVTDNEGKPVSPELSLGVVDEALYALREDSTPDIFEHFYGKKRNGVVTGYSVPREFTGGAFQKVAPHEKAEKIREHFKDTAYWNPSIQVDESGRAKVKVTLPDNLTTWRATCRAVTRDFRAGGTTDTVIAKKDLVARLGIPRYFISGDEVSLTSLIQNYTPQSQVVDVELALTGLALEGKAKQRITIPPRDSGGINFKTRTLPEMEGLATVTCFIGSDKGLTDRVSEQVPVLPRGISKKEYNTFTVEESALQAVEVPATAIPRTSAVTIRLTPTLLSGVLGSLSYLLDYPYGCVEQTMSRFYPDLAVAQAAKELGLDDGKIRSRLPDLITKCLGRLYSYQHADGGWGWWKEDRTDGYMTAYVMEGLSLTKSSGYPLDGRVYETGKRCLKGLFAGEKDITLKVYMGFVLSATGAIDASQLSDLYLKSEQMDVRGLALLSMACTACGDRDHAAALNSRIAGMAGTEGGYLFFRNAGKEPDLESTSLALRALAADSASHEKLFAGIIKWILSKRTGNYWESSKTTSMVILALTAYLVRSHEMTPAYGGELLWNGKSLKQFTVNEKSLAEGEIVIKPTEIRQHNTLEIKKSGSGNLYATSELSYFDRNLAPLEHGIRVTKQCFVRKSKDEWVEADAANLRAGQDLKVKVRVDMAGSHQYLILEDLLPSGGELVESSIPAATAWERAGDEKVAFFNEQVQNLWDFEYIVQMERPGRFYVLPATARLMYSPETYGISNSFEIHVNDR